MLLLDAGDVRSLLDYASCIAAVEEAFRCHGLGEVATPAVSGMHVTAGGFHLKAAVLGRAPSYFVVKANANFPSNPQRHGLPTIQGVVVLFDAQCGRPLAVLDSGEVTVRRTAAATAVAARHLARADSTTLTLCGCGVQGRAQLYAMCQVLPITKVFAHDADRSIAARFAAEMTTSLGIDVIAVGDLAVHARTSDVCITCTPSHEYVLAANDVKAGAFVAGVGADNAEKRELAPDLLARSRVVVDVLEQCAALGDLHHALEASAMTRADVHAEIGEVVAGRKRGRASAEEVVVFDSTGTALQDAAAAALVYERARRERRGTEFELCAARGRAHSGKPVCHGSVRAGRGRGSTPSA